MAPQPVPQQPANLSFDQIRPLIALMNNKKGSLNADISTLFDPQFGFMSGSFNQTSPEELDSLYAPQTNAVRNSGDSNLLGILGAMENGKSAFQIQQSINQKIADGSLPADPDGTGTEPIMNLPNFNPGLAQNPNLTPEALQALEARRGMAVSPVSAAVQPPVVQNSGFSPEALQQLLARRGM